MPYVVLFAELATAGFFVIFCALLATAGFKGPIFEISTKDPVGRTLIRSAQAALVTGYGVLFVLTFAEFGLLD